MQGVVEHMSELFSLAGLKTVLAAILSWALESVGHPNSAVGTLFLLMLSDLALGSMRAMCQDTFKWPRIMGWFWKSFRVWVAVVIFGLLDDAIGRPLPVPISLQAFFIAYLAVTEGLSCLDHLAFFGMPVPEGFLRKLRKYRDSLSNAGEDTDITL